MNVKIHIHICSWIQSVQVFYFPHFLFFFFQFSHRHYSAIAFIYLYAFKRPHELKIFQVFDFPNVCTSFWLDLHLVWPARPIPKIITLVTNDFNLWIMGLHNLFKSTDGNSKCEMQTYLNITTIQLVATSRAGGSFWSMSISSTLLIYLTICEKKWPFDCKVQ